MENKIQKQQLKQQHKKKLKLGMDIINLRAKSGLSIKEFLEVLEVMVDTCPIKEYEELEDDRYDPAEQNTIEFKEGRD